METPDEIDPRLQDIVERMFQRCAEDCEYEQAIGIALESRRLDIVKSIIQKGDASKLLSYVLDVCMTLVQNLEFRNEVLRLLVDLYKTLENPDYISISQCLVHLNDATSCAEMLKSLVDKKDELMAYQISFDLEENATQEFLSKVSADLPVEPETEKAEATTEEEKVCIFNLIIR